MRDNERKGPGNRLHVGVAFSLLAVAAIALLLLGCELPESDDTGSISVTSAPSGARIFLDRSDTGRVTPYVIPDVSAGSHSIHLTLAGHSDWGPRNVPVSAGRITTVHATLEPIDQPSPAERGLGLRRLDVEAYQNAHIIRADPVSLPSSVDLSVDAPIPGNQGLQGSCVGWAVAYALKTYHERIERGWPLTDNRHVMSPAYVYNQIKVPGGGAYFVDAFTLLIDQGVSSLAQMPYDPLDDRTQPSSRARAEAANYKIADWGTVLRNTHAVFVQELKRHLVAGDPVLIGIPVYPDFDNLSDSNPVYNEDSGGLRGHHAVVIVGYDDRRSAFKIANSWGTDWGIGGYGWIDYDASEWLIYAAYVTQDIVASPDDQRPDPASDPSPGSAATGVAVDTELRWTRNARTTSFDVYLGVDPHLSAIDFQGTVAQAEFSPHLAPGSVYYWRIDARGAGGITQGPVWTFTTAGALEQPGKAVNPSPTDGATGVEQNPELRWDSGGHTTSYDVYFGTDPMLGASDLKRSQAMLTFQPRTLRAGTRYYWRIDAKNGQGTMTGDVWTFTTEEAQEQDTSPVLPSIGDKTYRVGDQVSERLPAATGGNGSLTYSLTPSISGLTFDGGTRTLSGTPRQAGTYHMRYRVQDRDGDTDSQSFRVTVQAGEQDTSPVLPSIGDKTYRVGDQVSERLPAAIGGNGTLIYSLTPSVPGLTFDGGTRTLSGTPRQAGTYHMRYRVQDRDGDTDSQSFTVTVTDAQPPPSSSSKIYWTLGFAASDRSSNQIRRSNLDGTNVETIVYTGRHADGISFHNGKMYWTDHRAIHRSNPDGTGSETIVAYAFTCSGGCDFGIHGGKIYWSRGNGGSIGRADLDGANAETILSVYPGFPDSIAIHDGRIYWAEGRTYFTEDPIRRSEMIKRAHLDGTNIETLVVYADTGTSIWDIAVHDGKLYWSHWNRIYRSNLDGSASETFIHDSYVHAIAFHDGKIYWTDTTASHGLGHTKIKRAELANHSSGVETLIRSRNYFATGIAIYP